MVKSVKQSLQGSTLERREDPMFERIRSFALAGLLLVAAGSALLAGGARSAASVPRPVPTGGETLLLPGSYATSRFQPSFTFSTAGGWRVDHDVAHDVFFLDGSPCCGQHADANTGFLFFLQPAQVFDASRDVPVPTPRDLAAWLRHNPHLKTGSPSSIAVGGVPGIQFAAAFGTQTKNGGGCANIAPSTGSSFGPFGLCPGDRARLVVLTVEGKQLLIVIQSVPPDGFASFLPRALTFLRSIRFGPGPARAPAARTLLLGNADPTYDTELFFANQVARLSHGTLQISMLSGLHGDKPNNEQLVVDDLEHGKLDLAWDATRVWDKRGVTSFQGLQAPFLIDNLPLFKRVVTSPIAAEVASGTRKLGVLGLGLTAVNLRRPLGAKKPFLSLADFQGAKINVIASSLSEQAMQALGATPLELGGGLHDGLRTGQVDAAETAIDVVFENGFADVAKYITSNVVFFPKPASIDVNEAAFAKLTPAQRSVLRRAASATAAYSIDRLTAQQGADAAAICKQGIRFATATPAALAALFAAEQPVYNQLAQDPLTAHVLSEIEALKQQTPAGQPVSLPPGCAA
jgi:TRAP-type transport system periplasmic protein